MPHDRFYIDAPLEKTARLEGDEFHHLSRVMRKKEGDTIELVNGKHKLALASITSIDKKGATLTLLEVTEKKPLLPPCALIQAFPKLSNLELILQKGTELGASSFWIFQSHLSEKKEPSPTQLKRLHHILISAMKQCGRLDLPTLHFAFPEKPFENTYLATLEPNAPPLSSIAKPNAALIIGPEKGFTSEELASFKKIATPVSLGPYILRAETAAIAALAQIQQFV